MATIGTLAVNVLARTAPFESGMKRAGESAKGLQGVMNRAGGATQGFNAGMARASTSVAGFHGTLSNGIAKIAAWAGGLFAAHRAISRVSNAMQEISKTADVADMLGVQTEKLIGLRHAAEQAGIASNNFDLGFRRMIRRIAEAAQGGGTAAGAIVELGLSAKRLAAMAPDQAFLEIAEAMNKVENQGDRLRLAFKLFDTDGAKILNMLKMGRSGLLEMQQEAEKLGLTFTRMDAAAVAKAVNSFTQLRRTVGAFAVQLAIAFAPALEAATNALAKMAKWFHSLSATAKKTLITFGVMVSTATALATIIPTVAAAIRTVVAAQRAHNTAQVIGLALKGPQGWAILAGAAGAAAVTVAALSLVENQATAASELSAAAANRLADARLAESDATDLAKDKEAELAAVRERNAASVLASIGALREELTTLGMTTAQKKLYELATLDATMAQRQETAQLLRNIDARQSMLGMMERGRQLTEQLRTPQEVYNARVSEAYKMLRAGAIAMGTYRREVEAAAKSLHDAEQAQRGLTAAQEEADKPRTAGAVRGTVEGFRQIRETGYHKEANPEDKKQTELLKELVNVGRHQIDAIQSASDSSITVVENHF